MMKQRSLLYLGGKWSGAEILKHVAFALAYISLYWVSDVFHTTDLPSRPWEPEAGIAVAAGAILGWRVAPMFVLSFLLANFFWDSVFKLEWNDVLEVIVAAIFSATAAYFKDILHGLRTPTVVAVLRFLGYVLAVTLLLAVASVIISVPVLNKAPSKELSDIIALSVGNLIGIITIAPLFFIEGLPAILRRFFAAGETHEWNFLIIIVTISYFVFGLDDTEHFRFALLVLPPVVAFAIKDGFPGGVLATIITDVSMMAGLMLRASGPEDELELQIIMMTLACSGLILGAAVSERKRTDQQLAENRQLMLENQEALMHATRLSLATEIASALAHELNQPLSSIRSFIRAARRKLDGRAIDRKSIISNIDAAVGQVDGAAALIKETRQFLARGEVIIVTIDIGHLISGCMELVQVELKRARISLSVQLPEETLRIKGNTAQLQQVLLSLVRNAKEAIVHRHQGRQSIRIEASTELKPGFVAISVTDSGPGISPDLKTMLFKPLKSLKAEGLGLGLSLCSTIIATHGGEIWFDEGYRDGARFTFTLPIEAARDRSP